MHDERQSDSDRLANGFATPRPPAKPTRSAPGALRPLAIAALICLVALVAAAGLKTWRDLGTARDREAELERSITRAEAEIEVLEHRLHRLHDDPAALERLARKELQMTYPDEVVVILPREEEDEGPDEGVPTGRAPP